MSDFPQNEAGPSTQKGPAQSRSRSRACLHCRRRKMKCDGVKPACFQCIRAERGSECEYDDGTTKTQTQVLYERLQFLEKRLRELQATKGNPKGRLSARKDAGATRRSSRSGKSPMPPHQSELQPGNTYAYYDQRTNYGDPNAFSYNVAQEPGSRSPSLSRHSEGSLTPPSTTSSALAYPTDMSPHLHGRFPQSDYLPPPSNQDPSMHSYAYGQQQHENSLYFPYRDHLEGMSYMNFHESQMMNLSMNETFGSSTSGRSHRSVVPVMLPNGQELSPDVCRNLFDICFLHGHQIGITPLPSLIRNPNLNGVPLAAKYTTCLWGAHFSNNKEYTALKPWFLRRAIEELPDLLRQAQASREAPVIVDGEDPLDVPLPICQAIQVSTVLASYLYAHDRPLEGAYHASTAARLALASGLHHSQLFPSTPTSTFTTRGSGEGHTHPYYSYPTYSAPVNSDIPPSPVASKADLLAPPKTETEALRRLYVFWNCYIVDRSWNAMCPVPVFPWVISASFCRGDGRSAITAPWPQDWGLFGPEEQSLVTPTLSSRPSLADRQREGTPFENLLLAGDYGTQYRLELRAKSTALFDLAARLGDTRDPSNQCPMYTPAIAALQKLLSGFIKRLPPLEPANFSPTTFVEYTLFTTHSMAHASVIRLLYCAASTALDCGLLDGMSRTIIHSGSVREHESHKALIDVFSAYESFETQQQVDFYKTNDSRRMLEPVPDDKDAVKIAVDTGRLLACQDKCLAAARAIVKIVQQVNADQYSYLEPVISHCWTLAAKVFLLELQRLSLLCEQFPSSSPPSHVRSQAEKTVNDLRIIVAGLQRVGEVFPIGATHARNIEAGMNAFSFWTSA